MVDIDLYKLDILKTLVERDNLERIILDKFELTDYEGIYHILSKKYGDIPILDYFTFVKQLHNDFLIDATFNDTEVEKEYGAKTGTLKIRQEGIEYLINHK